MQEVKISELKGKIDYNYLRNILKEVSKAEVKRIREEKKPNKTLEEKTYYRNNRLIIKDEETLEKRLKIFLMNEVIKLFNSLNYTCGKIDHTEVGKKFYFLGMIIEIDKEYTEEEFRQIVLDAVGFEVIPLEEINKEIKKYNNIVDEYTKLKRNNSKYLQITIQDLHCKLAHILLILSRKSFILFEETITDQNHGYLYPKSIKNSEPNGDSRFLDYYSIDYYDYMLPAFTEPIANTKTK